MNGDISCSNSRLRDELQIAVFFDCENVNWRFESRVSCDLAARGRVLIRRAYGDFHDPHMAEWKGRCEVTAIDMIQKPKLSFHGKNAADIALVVDAMEMLVTRRNIQAFALVTCDVDFVPLVSRLREHGKRVIGFGGGNISGALCQAYDEFVRLSELQMPSEDRARSTSPGLHPQTTSEIGDTPMDKECARRLTHAALAQMVERGDSDCDGWVYHDHLLSYMKRLRRDWLSILTGWKLRWVEFLKACKELELMRTKVKGTTYHYVRLRPTLAAGHKIVSMESTEVFDSADATEKSQGKTFPLDNLAAAQVGDPQVEHPEHRGSEADEAQPQTPSLPPLSRGLEPRSPRHESQSLRVQPRSPRLQPQQTIGGCENSAMDQKRARRLTREAVAHMIDHGLGKNDGRVHHQKLLAHMLGQHENWMKVLDGFGLGWFDFLQTCKKVGVTTDGIWVRLRPKAKEDGTMVLSTATSAGSMGSCGVHTDSTTALPSEKNQGSKRSAACSDPQPGEEEGRAKRNAKRA